MSAMVFAGPAAAQTACADLTGFAVDSARIGLPVIEDHLGKTPDRMYHVGGSKGGHERQASTTADRFTKTSAVLGAGTDDSIRYYIQPGNGHGFATFNLGLDSPTALDSWVETGTAPQDPIATDGNTGASRQMPLCVYPAFPRYTEGGPIKADSFVCAVK